MAHPGTVGPWEPEYVDEAGWTTHRYDLVTGNTLRFAAKNVRREHTGVHANIAISLNWITLANTNFNIERDEDRVRLANSAYKHLDAKANALDMQEMPQQPFKHALDLFCLGLWDHRVSGDMGGWMEGDANVPPARPLLANYVLDSAGTILYAPPGSGKSYTAMAWAVSLLHGLELVWRVPEARVPLYVNLERSAVSMRGRLAAVNRALGLPPSQPMPFLNARGRSLSDVTEAVRRTIDQEGCSVLFYDSISRAGSGSMVADDVANRIMDQLNGLCPTWVAIGHSPRADEAHVYGSQMFSAAADVEVQLKAQTARDEAATGVGLSVTKANDIRTGGLTVHVLEWGEFGLTGIRRARPGEFAEIAAAEKKGVEQELAEFIETNGAASASLLAKALGRNRQNVSSLLANSNRFVKLGYQGHEVTYGLVSNRPTPEGWVN